MLEISTIPKVPKIYVLSGRAGPQQGGVGTTLKFWRFWKFWKVGGRNFGKFGSFRNSGKFGGGILDFFGIEFGRGHCRPSVDRSCLGTGMKGHGLSGGDHIMHICMCVYIDMSCQ